MPQYGSYADLFVANTDRYPSPVIWSYLDSLSELQGKVVGLFDHFVSMGDVPPTTQGSYGIYRAFTSTGGAIADGNAQGGEVVLSSDGDDEGASIATWPFIHIANTKGLVGFEARVATSTITSTKHGFFLGVIDTTGMTAISPIAADGTLANVNFVGFHRLEGDGDAIDCVYKADGITQVTSIADAHVLVVDTFVKLGFWCDPVTGKLIWVINGVPQATTVAVTAVGTAGPWDVPLGPAFAVLNATATTPGNSYLDWWKCLQAI